jgi:hypothetical protein
MKKILAISGIILGAVFLAGCGKKAATTPNVQTPAPTVAPASPMDKTAPTENTTSAENNSMTPDSSTTNLPTTPAKTSDVDASLNQVTKDLNSVDSNAPNPNDINSTDLQK